MNVVILAGVCLFAQFLLALGWLSTATALGTWAVALKDGWRKESIDALSKKMPLMSNVAQQNVVLWKGKPHLKEASADWLTLAKIEEDCGSPQYLLYGLCGGVLLTTLTQFSASNMSEPWLPMVLLGMVCISIGLLIFVH